MTMSIVVTGIEAAQRRLDPDRFARGLRDGFQEAGDLIGAAARRIVQPHHAWGTFEQGIHTEVSGAGWGIVAHVGVSSAKVPEARSLTFGWASRSGKRPPTAAIERWLDLNPRGIAIPANMSKHSFAFIIARAIGKRGYTFGSGTGGQKLDVWRRAFAETRHLIGRVIARQLARER